MINHTALYLIPPPSIPPSVQPSEVSWRQVTGTLSHLADGDETPQLFDFSWDRMVPTLQHKVPDGASLSSHGHRVHRVYPSAVMGRVLKHRYTDSRCKVIPDFPGKQIPLGLLLKASKPWGEQFSPGQYTPLSDPET